MRKNAVCLGVLALAALASSLQATTLVLGDPPIMGLGNCDPFGCPGFLGLGTYQQVYLSSAFPGTISIQGLTFYEGQVLNGGQPSAGTYSLSFSYTSFDPGGLDLTSPANNIGSGSQSFFSGTLPALTPEGPGNWLVLAGTPFVYNPADGNLLLTLTYSGSSNGSPVLYLNEAGTNTVSSSAYFGANASGGNISGGLVTGFDYGPVAGTPEPGSILLTLAGIGLIGVFFRRRRRIA